ncbi:DeoR/GlpR family DNA-binding transcription regulator [Neptunomonas antarctica]|uniref:Transcriptional regulator, DeoR family n=1 Tax=Neptunomonas antarctica TaxID=619304 RepID=A0A1N7NHX1_9GAMM|nr:DeoR/GlpR family DNA-binding transcription regulator [Neptunomonas antarctica]SIS97848.1 transcriptional regulator, DeoR family [Neptunomonas antarctica]
MQLSERQRIILQRVRDEGGTLSSSVITNLFDVSIQTIRKDLNELSDLGLVKRVHGGITLPVQNHNLSFSNRQVINLQAKQAIAQRVAASIPEGSSLFLGIGTTPQQIAQALLQHTRLTVVTNNLNAAITLCQNSNIKTYLCGGLLRPADQDLTGEDATQFLRKFQVNYGIFGVGGLAENGDLLDFSPEEAHISSAIMDNSEHRILVADKSKYLRSAPIKTAEINAINSFYTDSLPHALRILCADACVEVIECVQEKQ